MEFSEDKFKKLMAEQGVGKLAKSTAENFEQLMKKNGLENIAGKEGHKFIVRGRDEENEDFKFLAEFDTIEEARDWYDSVGQLVVEEGGELRLNYEMSESFQFGKEKEE